MPRHPKTVSLRRFKGLNNVGLPETIDPSFLTKAINIDIGKNGNITKREGYTKIIDGQVTSMWSSNNGLGCYFVLNGNLYRLLSNYTYTLIRSNVGEDPIAFEEVDEDIYYISRTVSGNIYNGIDSNWGIDKNTLSPTLSYSSGTLSSGTYQVSFTYVSTSGIESGSGVSSFITIPDNSSISLYIPTHISNHIASARVYCSTPNGNQLYFVGKAGLGSNFTISSINTTRPFRFFNLDPPPKGELLKHYKGRLYIANKNILYYSFPFQYHHFDLGYGYIEFPNDIDAILPVEDGLWVCSDRIYYISGDSPETFKRSVKEYAKVVKGTETRFSGSYLHLENTPVGYKWLVTTDIGIFILFNQGLIINVTSTNLDIARASSGSGLFLQSNGNNQYISILKTNDKPSNSVMGDMVEATIVRNGVTIQ